MKALSQELGQCIERQQKGHCGCGSLLLGDHWYREGLGEVGWDLVS